MITKNTGNILKPPGGARRRNRIAGQFAWRLIEMLESPAYRVLSLSGHRILDRLEIELAHHAGHDNGALPVTYSDFESYGIDRHAIAPAVREVEALGFVRIAERGRAGNAEYRTPNKFALTYRPAKDRGPTDDWRNIRTIEEAEAIAHAARTPIKKRCRQKKYFPVGVFTNFSGQNHHRKSNSPVGETPTTAIPEKPPLLFIYRGGDAGSAPATPLNCAAIKPVARKLRRRKK
jgi:hypothetical protein